MATPPRTLALTMDAFPDCPDAFRPTLEALLAKLNEQSQAISVALNKGLTRKENMRSGLASATGIGDASASATAKVRCPITTTPTAVWPVRVESLDGSAVGFVSLSSWRPVQGGMLELRWWSQPGAKTRITVVVE